MRLACAIPTGSVKQTEQLSNVTVYPSEQIPCEQRHPLSVMTWTVVPASEGPMMNNALQPLRNQYIELTRNTVWTDPTKTGVDKKLTLTTSAIKTIARLRVASNQSRIKATARSRANDRARLPYDQTTENTTYRRGSWRRMRHGQHHLPKRDLAPCLHR